MTNVLVIGDGYHPEAYRLWADSGLPGRYLSIRGPTGDWGGAARSLAMRVASANYLAFLDDDDAYLPGALAAIREALAQAPNRPHMFRMRRPSVGDVLWVRDELIHGNVSTQMFVVPNCPSRLGRWGGGYGGDWDFAVSTLSLWQPRALVWRKEIIVEWNVGG